MYSCASLPQRHCGEHRVELGHQMFVMQKLEEIAHRVKAAPTKQERLDVCL
jgi:hypothetical protein